MTLTNGQLQDHQERPRAACPAPHPGQRAQQQPEHQPAGRGRGTSFARPLTPCLRGRHCALMCRGGVCAARFSPGRGAGQRNRRLRSPADSDGPGPCPRLPPTPTSALSLQSPTSVRWGPPATARGKAHGALCHGPRPGARPATGSLAGSRSGRQKKLRLGNGIAGAIEGPRRPGEERKRWGRGDTEGWGLRPLPGLAGLWWQNWRLRNPGAGSSQHWGGGEGRGGGGARAARGAAWRGGVAVESPPPPAAAIGGGRGAGAGAAIGARSPVTEGLAGGSKCARGLRYINFCCLVRRGDSPP